MYTNNIIRSAINNGVSHLLPLYKYYLIGHQAALIYVYKCLTGVSPLQHKYKFDTVLIKDHNKIIEIYVKFMWWLKMSAGSKVVSWLLVYTDI